MLKSIHKIIPSQLVNMGGNLLDQPLPAQGVNYIDPFLLIHHWKSELPGNQNVKEVGVGVHPHRGFSPVTFIYKGSIQHRDSLGNNALVGEGGTQWMFAGSGISHSERFGKDLVEKGGELEFIQFWVNAPAKNKMDAPFYKPISKAETPTISENGSEIKIVCGEYEDKKGSVSYYSPLTLLRVEIEKGKNLVLDLEETHNVVLYLLDGEIMLNNQMAKAKELVWFKPDGKQIEISATETTRFMVLSGEPLNEPMVSYGRL